MPYYVVYLPKNGSTMVEASNEQQAVLSVPEGVSARLAQWREIQSFLVKNQEDING